MRKLHYLAPGSGVGTWLLLSSAGPFGEVGNWYLPRRAVRFQPELLRLDLAQPTHRVPGWEGGWGGELKASVNRGFARRMSFAANVDTSEPTRYK